MNIVEKVKNSKADIVILGSEDFSSFIQDSEIKSSYSYFSETPPKQEDLEIDARFRQLKFDNKCVVEFKCSEQHYNKLYDLLPVDLTYEVVK